MYSIPKTFLIPTSNLFNVFDCYLSDPNSYFSKFPIEYARLLVIFVELACLVFLLIAAYLLMILILKFAMKFKFNYIRSVYLNEYFLIGGTIFILYLF